MSQDHDVQEDKIFLLSLLMAEMGVHSVAYAFPRVRIITTAVDKKVNEEFHIIPGIGKWELAQTGCWPSEAMFHLIFLILIFGFPPSRGLTSLAACLEKAVSQALVSLFAEEMEVENICGSVATLLEEDIESALQWWGEDPAKHLLLLEKLV